MIPFKQAVSKLAGNGIQITPARLKVARLLFEYGQDRHVTAMNIQRELLQGNYRVSFRSLRDTLELFEHHGLVRSIWLGGLHYYDTNVEPHHHLFDDNTRWILDIPWGAFGTPQLPKGVEMSRTGIIIGVNLSCGD